MGWRVQAAGQFYDPGERTVIYYHPRSGDTHLISSFAAHVLRQLELAAEPVSTAELVTQLTPDMDADPAAVETTLVAVLEELAAMDLLIAPSSGTTARSM